MSDIIKKNMGCIPFTHSPFGCLGPLIHNYMNTNLNPTVKPLINVRRPVAKELYHHALHSPTPVGLIQWACDEWSRNKPSKYNFYGNFYTAPTPWEFWEQQSGLVITAVTALHIRDALDGALQREEGQNSV